jgi:hypothetical protein
MNLPAHTFSDTAPHFSERYDTGIITGALLWSDTKILAALLLEGRSPADIREAVSANNSLLRRSKKRSSNVTSYLLQRFKACPDRLLELIVRSDSDTSKQAAFVASLITSRFLRDFMNEVVCEILEGATQQLPSHFWRDFWGSCVSKDPELSELRDKAVREVRSTLLRFLVEIGILEGIRARELQRITLTPQIQAVLMSEELSTVRFYLRSFVR